MESWSWWCLFGVHRSVAAQRHLRRQGESKYCRVPHPATGDNDGRLLTDHGDGADGVRSDEAYVSGWVRPQDRSDDDLRREDVLLLLGRGSRQVPDRSAYEPLHDAAKAM